MKKFVLAGLLQIAVGAQASTAVSSISEGLDALIGEREATCTVRNNSDTYQTKALLRKTLVSVQLGEYTARGWIEIGKPRLYNQYCFRAQYFPGEGSLETASSLLADVETGEFKYTLFDECENAEKLHIEVPKDTLYPVRAKKGSLSIKSGEASHSFSLNRDGSIEIKSKQLEYVGWVRKTLVSSCTIR